MGISSYAVGLVPLSFPLPAPKVRAISILGSGILVGTALVVIIPEGISMIYRMASHLEDSHELPTSSDIPENDMIRLTIRHGGTDSGPRAQVGLALLLGFIFMYIIEKLSFLIAAFSELFSAILPSSRSSSGSFTSIDMSTIRNNIFGGISSRVSSAPATPSTPANLEAGNSVSGTRSPYSHHHRTDSIIQSNGTDGSPTPDSSNTSSTALGLVIHAIADGIALGASIASGDSSVEAIVFLAIMIHKAPASFGLSAVVLQTDGVQGAKRTLALFAAAAPVGAILTYFIIVFLGSSDTELINWWTGILLLFSGGTFLYVAVHVMQELDQAQHGTHGEQEIYHSTNTTVTDGADALLGIIGMLLPLLTLFVPED